MIIKVIIKKYLKNLVNERFDQIKESTNEISHYDARKKIDDFHNNIEVFRKYNLIKWS